ncbi:hypothetical protein GCM10009872_54430 [Actinopolymorpha rutila]
MAARLGDGAVATSVFGQPVPGINVGMNHARAALHVSAVTCAPDGEDLVSGLAEVSQVRLPFPRSTRLVNRTADPGASAGRAGDARIGGVR